MSRQIQKVGFTVYPVRDMARAREFYERVLGLPPGEFFNDEWREYDIGGTTFAIDSAPMPFLTPGSQSSLTLEVSNVHALTEELRAKGVVIVHDVIDTPVCWMGWIRDPDGNILGLHQLK